MYTFVYKRGKEYDVNKAYDINLIGEYASSFRIFSQYNWYHATTKYPRHTLHAIGRACNDEILEGSFIIEIDDDMEALAFRLCSDKFIRDESASLAWLIQDMDLVTPLKEGTELKWLIDHDTSRTEATMAVSKLRNKEYDFTQAMNRLNGGLGDDLDVLWKEFNGVLQARLKAHHDNLKPSLAKLNKERKELLKYLDKYNKK
jgi:hypothetical protein